MSGMPLKVVIVDDRDDSVSLLTEGWSRGDLGADQEFQRTTTGAIMKGATISFSFIG
jgi:hypothetical protein